MRRATEARAWAVLTLTLVLGCARPPTRELEVGAHRVRVAPPPGWEILEHGRQTYFRNGERMISLTDLGPSGADGMLRDLEAARAIWLAGRRKDAYARVRELRGPGLRFATREQRGDYWRTWNDVTFYSTTADSASIGRAFEDLMQGTKRLPKAAPHSKTEYVLEKAPQAQRKELARGSRVPVHGREWTTLETWDRVSHMDRRRLAVLDDRGYFLVLAIDRGPIEETGPVFDALLSSIEVIPDPPRAR